MSLPNDDIDRLVTTYREEFNPDVERALERLHGKLSVVHTLHPKPRVSNSSRLRRRWSVAAAVILLLASITAYLLGGDGRTYLRNPDRQLAQFELPDGSSLTLQQGGEVSYDAEDYGQATRTVRLRGQAYFEINADASRPFLVQHNGTELRVTGTAFNLRTQPDLLEVEVSEGSVLLIQGKDRIPVSARECGLAESGRPIVHKAAPNLNHHAWRTGELTFDHTPIAEVLSYFKANWSIECEWATGDPCAYTVSGNYRGGAAGEVLSDIAKLGGLTLKPLDASGKRFTLEGSCTD